MAFNIGSIRVTLDTDGSKAITGLKGFQNALQRTVSNAKRRLDELKASFNTIHFAIAAALGVAIVKVGADFDKQMTNVRAITKSTTAEFTKMRREVISLANELDASAPEAAKALFQIVSAGFKGSDAMALLSAAIRQAKAGLIDINTSAEVLIGTLNAFGKSGEEAESVAGKLLATNEKGILTFDQLAQSLGVLSPLAASFNIRLEEMLAILSTLTRNGVAFNRAVVQTRAIVTGLLSPSKEAGEALKQIFDGIPVEDKIKQSGFIETLHELIDASHGSAAALATIFPNVRAISGATGLLGDKFEGLISDFEYISQAGTNLNTVFEIQRKSISSLIEEIGNLIRNQLVEYIDDNRATIVGLLLGLREWIKNNKALINNIVSLTAIVAAAGAAGLVLKGIIAGLSTALKLLLLPMKLLQLLMSRELLVSLFTAIARFEIWIRGIRAATVATTADTTAIVLHTAALSTDTVAAEANTVANAGRLARLAKVAPITAVLATGVVGTGRALGALVAAAIPAVAPLLAITATAVGFYKLGNVIDSMVPTLHGWTGAIVKVMFPVLALRDAIDGLSEVSRKEIEGLNKANKELDKIFQRAKQEADLSGIDKEKSAVEQRETLLKQLAEAARDAANGSTEAYNKLKELQSQLATSGSGDAIEILRVRFQNLQNQLDQTRKAARDSSNTEITRLQAFIRVAGGSVQEGEKLDQVYQQLKDTIQNYNAATSDAAEATRQAQSAQADFNRILQVTESQLASQSGEIQSVIDKINEAGKTTEEKAVEQLNSQADKIKGFIQALVLQEAQIRAAIASGTVSAGAGGDTLANIQQQYQQSLTALQAIAEQRKKIEEDAAAEREKVNQEALDQITQYEIDTLKRAGKFKEAEQKAAKARYEQTLKRIRKEKDLRDSVREQLTRAAQRAYESELLQIDQNEKAREEANRRETEDFKTLEELKREAATREEAELIRKRILQAQAAGDVRTELELRQELVDKLKEANDLTNSQVEADALLTKQLSDRVDLFQQQLIDLGKAGNVVGAGKFVESARQFQQRTLGSSDVGALRGSAREKFGEIESTKAIKETQDAFVKSLKVEALALQKARPKAVAADDEEEVRRIDQQLREIAQKYRIVNEEAKRAEEEILLREHNLAEQRKKLNEEVANSLKEDTSKALSEEKRQKETARARSQGLITKDEQVVGVRPGETGRRRLDVVTNEQFSVRRRESEKRQRVVDLQQQEDDRKKQGRSAQQIRSGGSAAAENTGGLPSEANQGQGQTLQDATEAIKHGQDAVIESQSRIANELGGLTLDFDKYSGNLIAVLDQQYGSIVKLRTRVDTLSGDLLRRNREADRTALEGR